MKAFNIYPVGESTLTVSFGNAIDPEINKKVFQLYDRLLQVRHPSWLDIIPAYSTLSIVYDVYAIRQQHSSAFDWVKRELEQILSVGMGNKETQARKLQIPVCYDAEFALDAGHISKEKNISVDELIKIHTSKVYQVFMIGFLPGFAYMGSVDSRIATPRLATPRTTIAAGSVGIAGEQTGIYPLDSPGGWNIIGRTPLNVFDLNSDQPVLFQPGDEIKFLPITKTAFQSFDRATYNAIVHEH